MTYRMHTRLLGVNIDHVATLRQARGTRYPDPVQAAFAAEQAGADLITLHLREDRRHIQDRDVEILADSLQTRMNLEMAATDEMFTVATRIKPADCCLVPERREELTTEGGLDATAGGKRLRDYCEGLAAADIRVSLFIDADSKQIEAAAAAGAPVIELHTGHYADATSRREREAELARLRNAVAYGRELGLEVNAGHGLNYQNIGPVADIAGILEFNIGHAIIARALFVGLEAAVADMKRLIQLP